MRSRAAALSDVSRNSSRSIRITLTVGGWETIEASAWLSLIMTVGLESGSERTIPYSVEGWMASRNASSVARAGRLAFGVLNFRDEG
jgi:hypothetical protein